MMFNGFIIPNVSEQNLFATPPLFSIICFESANRQVDASWDMTDWLKVCLLCWKLLIKVLRVCFSTPPVVKKGIFTLTPAEFLVFLWYNKEQGRDTHQNT